MGQGSNQAALDHYRGVLKVANQSGFGWMAVNARKYLGNLALEMGDVEAALDHLVNGLTLAVEMDHPRAVVALLYELARLEAVRHENQRAMDYLFAVKDHPISRRTILIDQEKSVSENASLLLEELLEKINSTDDSKKAMQRSPESLLKFANLILDSYH
jgi:hypothetical protein